MFATTTVRPSKYSGAVITDADFNAVIITDPKESVQANLAKYAHQLLENTGEES